MPSLQDRIAAAAIMPSVIVDSSNPMINSPQPPPSFNGADWGLLEGKDINEQIAAQGLAAAAVALLLDNEDLLAWAVCLACSWDPLILDTEVAGIVAEMLDGLHGAYVINLVATEHKAVPGSEGGATGWAWDHLHVANDNTTAGSLGPIMPMEHWAWANLPPGAAYEFLMGLSEPNCRSLCAVAAFATDLIHEMMHIAAGYPLGTQYQNGYTDDYYNIWAPQNMASISWLWALAQRYPGLQNTLCCPKTPDLYFMTSEPDPAYVPNTEPYPWSWDINAPC